MYTYDARMYEIEPSKYFYNQNKCLHYRNEFI